MSNLAIGIIKTSHGVHGDMKVHSYSGEFDHFFSLKKVTLKKDTLVKEFEVESFKMAQQVLLMNLKGIRDPETAKKYNGFEIWVPRSAASQLQNGEYYYSDLVGMALVFEGVTKGTIRNLTESPVSDILEVVLLDGKVVLVPFMERYIGEVDLVNRIIPLKVDWILQ